MSSQTRNQNCGLKAMESELLGYVSGEDRVSVGKLNVLVPNDLLIDALKIYGDEFKRFGWVNRLRLKMPDSLKQLTDKAVLIGPVLKSPAAKLKRTGGGWREM